MSIDESGFKTRFCKILRDEGGYGRRIEDKFGVGIPDILAVPRGGPVFYIEAKIIRNRRWGATPRQAEELRRFSNSVNDHGYACEMGLEPDTNTLTIRRVDDDNPENWWNYKFSAWTRLAASAFLVDAHILWSLNSDR